MLRSTNSQILVFRNVAIIAVGVLFARVSYDYLSQLIRIDPFASFRREAGILPESIGARMDNVRFRHYRGNKLVAKAEVGRMDMGRDRNTFALFDIRKGEYYGAEGGPVHFSAQKGDWNSAVGQLLVEGNVKAKNKDFDLSSAALRFDQRKKQLEVPKPLNGRLLQGRIKAESLRYDFENGAFGVNQPRYVGSVDVIQDIQNDKRSWQISADRMESQGGGVVTYTQGTATDGEIIVSAPHLEWNKKTDVLTATKKAYYYSGKANLVADKIVIYRKEKRAVLSGNVKMLVKSKDEEIKPPKVEEIQPFRPNVPAEVAQNNPSPNRSPEDKQLDEELQSPSTLRKYPLFIESSQIEYWYAKGNRKAKITGEPKAMQHIPGNRWRKLTTFEAFYDGEAETLKLMSPQGKRETHMTTSLGDDLFAFWFLLNVKEEDEDRYSGEGIKGTFHTDDEELPRGDNKGTPPPKR